MFLRLTFENGNQKIIDDSHFTDYHLRQMVRNQGITCSRKNPRRAYITVEKQKLDNDKITWVFYQNTSADIPLSPMTEAEFNEEESSILSDIPEEFHSTLSYYAYEKSHSYGREEVISTLRELVDSLREPIKNYTKRIAKAFSG